MTPTPRPTSTTHTQTSAVTDPGGDRDGRPVLPAEVAPCAIAYRCVPGLYRRPVLDPRGGRWPRSEPAPAETPPADCPSCHGRPAAATTRTERTDG